MTRGSVAKRIRDCVIVGACFGSFYAAWVVVLALLNGVSFFEARSISLSLLVTAFVLGGVIGGAVVGLFLPLTRSWFGAAIVGFLVSLPIVHLVGLSGGMVEPFGADELTNSAITAGLLGPAGAIVLRIVFRGHPLDPR